MTALPDNPECHQSQRKLVDKVTTIQVKKVPQESTSLLRDVFRFIAYNGCELVLGDCEGEPVVRRTFGHTHLAKPVVSAFAEKTVDIGLDASLFGVSHVATVTDGDFGAFDVDTSETVVHWELHVELLGVQSGSFLTFRSYHRFPTTYTNF